jgi:hypothetical protein
VFRSLGVPDMSVQFFAYSVYMPIFFDIEDSISL